MVGGFKTGEKSIYGFEINQDIIESFPEGLKDQRCKLKMHKVVKIRYKMRKMHIIVKIRLRSWC